jgi:Big-like domain-containing protein
VFYAPGNLILAADASDSDGAIAKVDFYQGATLLGTATAAPYRFTWSNVPAGVYSVTAVATDDRGGTTTSAAITVIIDIPPTVSLTSPANNAVFTAPASVTIAASAGDADGAVGKVEFFLGSPPQVLLGTSTAAPYSFNWTNVPQGSYALTAVATDDRGVATSSAPVVITVNTPPTVSITSPADGAVFAAPATITVTATASDPEGALSKVDFYQGTTLIGTATTAPYSATASNLISGTYSFTAVATDGAGASTTSAVVNVRVNAAPTVSITTPTSGVTFNAPANIAISADAADTDGTIVGVAFYQNGVTSLTLSLQPRRT